MGKIIYGILNKGKDAIFCFGKICHFTEGVILGYSSLMGNETPQWMKDDLQGGIETFGDVFLNTFGNGYGKKDLKILKIHQKESGMYVFGNNPNHSEVTNFQNKVLR